MPEVKMTSGASLAQQATKTPIKNHTSGHRRDKPVLVMSYDYAVCKGRVLWSNIQAAFNGQRPPGRQFGQADFDSSWTLVPEPSPLPNGGHWENPFKSFSAAAAAPVGPSVRGLAANQDKTFKNVAGRPVALPTKASYKVQYLPGWSAMLATSVQSPSKRLIDSDDSPYGHVIEAKDIPTLIPPMHRLSDVSWYVWSILTANPGTLRCIGHDFITTGETTSIMEYLQIARMGHDDGVLPWPGLVYDINSDEAKALLATPNSLATAYIYDGSCCGSGEKTP
ncbi:MAG: hypothetical protein Q9223_002411 [Gallowayella weberi]